MGGAASVPDSDELRKKRLAIWAARRGTREMDLILSRYSAARLAQMNPAALDLFESLLAQNDQDLYQWISGQSPAPAHFRALVAEIAQTIAQALRL
ncbi:MAG: succinate dehydrogenase assembly factor 2 [Rhodobacteraceae bacterium]|nr:succinate dehydrogenase assembly factor 2 [Paracoccaceae bacterium]